MASSTRTFLLIFLAMLQFIAPLVHAHAGQESSSFGLHIPGLETYNVADDKLVSEAVIYDASSEGLVFGVGEGIKQYRNKTVPDHQGSHFLPQQPVEFRFLTVSDDSGFPPRLPQFISRFSIPSLSPRAPPVL